MRNRISKLGQTMLEFVIIMGMSLGLILTVGFFMYVFKEHGGRILDVVSHQYYP